ncbi:MAG: hypothetical protein ACK5H2_03240 [Beutenbergiaceae bacterium]
MRWDDLFADLAGQWQAQARAASEDEIRELAHAEAAGIRLVDRIRGLRGAPITVRLADGVDLRGSVADAADEWLLLADGERRHLIPVAAVAAIWPLAGAAPASSRVERALGLGYLLRGLAAERHRVQVRTRAGEHQGTIVRVGADHLDLATDAGGLSLPWSGLLCVSSR